LQTLTNAEKDAFSIPERNVSRNLEDIIRTIKGRLIIGTLSSQFERMINIITVAESLGKKILLKADPLRQISKLLNAPIAST
jgi:mRNA degradation ribonuclease J1/J2